MEKDYHKVVYNQIGHPEHKLQVGKMIKSKTSLLAGTIAAGVFAVGFAAVVFYNRFRHG